MKTILTGKHVLVLGASSGLGLATAQAAAAEGAYITIVSGNQERMERALATLPAGSKGYVMDLGEEQHIRTFFEGIGNFDHLVYTAGEHLHLNEVMATDLDAARKFFNIRYWGAFASVKYGAAHINEGGSITLTGGIANQRPGKGWSLGASICGAMDGFMRAMAVELAPIRVNLVSPGVVRTNLWNDMNTADREALYANVGAALLVKRVGEATEIAQSYIYLMKQAFGTGQVLIVDGGTVLV